VENGTLTFAPGQTSETINIPVTNHTLASESEAFTVVLSNPVDVGGSTPTISQTTGRATLYNPLFTTGADSVDFNNLTAAQQQAIAAGADRTHGLGGNDNVTLPNSGNATFYTGSTTSDTDYQVKGGGGNYTIFEGAGTETISFNGNGTSTVTAGSGQDTITITGNGNNTIYDGNRADTINISSSDTNTIDTIVDNGEGLLGTINVLGTLILSLTGTDAFADTL
jgi:hypothetical protein